MNLTNLFVGILVGFLFYAVATFIIVTAGIGIPTIIVVLVSILVGFLVYQKGITL